MFSRALPGLVIAGTNIAGDIVNQAIVAMANPTAAAFYQISSLATGIIPTSMPPLNVYFSRVFRKKGKPDYDPTEIGRIYQANTLISMGLALLNIPMIAATPSILRLPFASGFGFTEDNLMSLERGIAWAYPMVFLSAMLNNDATLFFQNRNLNSVAALLAVLYGLGLPLTYALTTYTDMGFEGIMLSDCVATAAAILTAKVIQLGYVPDCLKAYFPDLREYALFDFSAENRARWGEEVRNSLRRGWSTLLAELGLNLSQAVVGLNPDLSSDSLNGGLSVLQSAGQTAAAVVMDAASPYIAEARSERMRAIILQTLLALAGPLAMTALSLPLARTLSASLGGAGTEGVSDEALLSNTGLVMAGGAASTALMLLYETLLDVAVTERQMVIPGLLVSLGALLIVPLAYLFQNKLSGTEADASGNFGIMMGTFAGFLLLAAYAARNRAELFGARPEEPAVAEGAHVFLLHDGYGAVAVDIRPVPGREPA